MDAITGHWHIDTVRTVDPAALARALDPVDAVSGGESPVDFAVADDLLAEALDRQRWGDYESAEKILLAARLYLVKKRRCSSSELSPVSYRTHVLLGNVYRDTGKWGKAVDFYSGACAIWNKAEQKDIMHPMSFLPNLKECARELEKVSKRQRQFLVLSLFVIGFIVWNLRAQFRSHSFVV